MVTRVTLKRISSSHQRAHSHLLRLLPTVVTCGHMFLSISTNKAKSILTGLTYFLYSAVLLKNPCFSVYEITTTCPMLWDVLGFPGSFAYLPEGAEIYFNRTDVQKAINAPIMEWEECSTDNVFVGGHDSSDPSTWSALPRAIEKNERTIIGHGLLDFILMTNGTLYDLPTTTSGLSLFCAGYN